MSAKPTFSTLGKRRMPKKPEHPQQQHRPSVTFCTECDYLRKERAGMWIDSGADIETADQAAQNERCKKT
jgi:hypothetical protein